MIIPAEKQCTFEWNPGVWPYAARCIKAPHTAGEHVSRLGHRHEGISPPTQRKELPEEIFDLVRLLTGPGPLTSHVRNDKLHMLSIAWPSLAAALGRVVEITGSVIPTPLRRAMHVLEGEE